MVGKRMMLGKFLYECPPSWQNFIYFLETHDYPKNNDDSFSVDTLNQELSLFDATYCVNPESPFNYVDFKDESSYILFTLVHG